MASLFHASTNLGHFLSRTNHQFFFLRHHPPAIASEHASWEDIPIELMDSIYAKVGLSDRHSLGAVCKSWASMKKECFSRIRELPWIVLPRDKTCPELRCLNLSQATVEKLKLPEPLRDAEFICSTNGWLSFIKIKYHGMTDILKEPHLFLFNPVSRQLLKLPSIPKTPCYRKSVSGEDMKVKYIVAIAISSNQLNESTMVAAIFCDGLELAVCKPGDERWTIFTGNYDLKEYVEMMESVVEKETDCYYAEVLFRDDTLFVLAAVAPHVIGQVSHPDHFGIYFLGSLKLNFINVFLDWDEEEDLSSLCSDCLLLPNEFDEDEAFIRFFYLTLSVEDELLLAIQWVGGEESESEDDDVLPREATKRIAIFKLDVEVDGGVRFSRLRDVGDQVIFLGGNGSQVVDSKEFSGIQGNSVFFVENFPSGDGGDGDRVYISRECGEYSLVNDKAVRSLPSCIESFEFRIDWFSPNQQIVDFHVVLSLISFDFSTKFYS